jgi:proline iminopeptidase
MKDRSNAPGPRKRRPYGLIAFATIVLFSTMLAAGAVMAQGSKETTGAYAWVDGAHLWFQIKGRGDPVVVIAGGPGDSHLYLTPWFDELAKRYKVIYYDAFGRGKSDRAKNPSEYSFDRDVRDLEGLRKALGIDKWSVIGHSYGGMVAQAYALKYPGSVDKLILSNTFYDGEMWQENDDNSNYEIRNQYPEVWAELMKLRDQGMVSSSPECERLYGQVPGGLLYYYDAADAAKVVKDSASFNSLVYYQLVGADGDFLIGGDIGKLDFRTALKQLKMPVLILAGRFDRVAVPRFSEKFQEYCPQAKFVMFEKSGHLPFIEETREYFETVEEFLKNGK